MLDVRIVFGFAFLTAFAAVSAFAGGRVNNGGTAIECFDRSGKSTGVVMLDAFERGLAEEAWPAERRAFAADVFRRLAAADPDLANRWRTEWEMLGGSATWPPSSGTEDPYSSCPIPSAPDALFPVDQRQIAPCRLMTVSFFSREDRVPRRNPEPWDRMTERQRRVLELHESLYVVGVRDFGHGDPVRTRALVGALLDGRSGSADGIAAAARVFRRPPVTAGIAGAYALASGDPNCPASVAVEDPGTDARHLLIAGLSPASRKPFVLGFRLARSDFPRWRQSISYAPLGPDGFRFAFDSLALSVEGTFSSRDAGVLEADLEFVEKWVDVGLSRWEARACRYALRSRQTGEYRKLIFVPEARCRDRFPEYRPNPFRGPYFVPARIQTPAGTLQAPSPDATNKR